MVLYLLAGSALTTARSYVASAAAAALRMSLHESRTLLCISGEERVSREQSFRTLQALDVNVSSLLGLPKILPTPATPQSELHQFSLRPRNSPVARFSSDLLNTLDRALETVYFSNQSMKAGGKYRVSCRSTHESCTRLREWRLYTWKSWRPDSDKAPTIDLRYVKSRTSREHY